MGGEDLVQTGETQAKAASPSPPPAGRGIAIPKSAELDPELEAQLSAGMGDDALSLQMNAAAAKAGAGGPAIDGTQDSTGADAPPPGGADEGATPSPMVGGEESLEPGQKLMGKVDSKTDSDVFVNLGLRYQGIIPRTDYPDGKGPPVGFSGAFLVDHVDTANGLIHLHSPRGARKVTGGDWDSLSVGQNVECSVTGTNKGGLQVQVGKLRGFMPASQIDLGYVEDMAKFKGQKLNARIIEVKPEKRNLVLSRAAILKEERKGKEAEVWETLKPGETRPGIVRALKPYGAFVDIGGVDGFLHIGEISHNRIGHPKDVLSVGEKIEVKVLKVEPEAKKVGLGMKQLTKDPWQVIEESYPVGSTCTGKVTKCTEFGAFVEIEKGIEGLIHISELDHKRVSRVSDVVRMGEEVETKVLTVEPNRKRIALSLKALKEKPASSGGGKPRKRKNDEPDLPAYERQRKGPLKGGVGDPKGGLFGDPSNFGGVKSESGLASGGRQPSVRMRADRQSHGGLTPHRSPRLTADRRVHFAPRDRRRQSRPHLAHHLRRRQRPDAAGLLELQAVREAVEDAGGVHVACAGGVDRRRLHAGNVLQPQRVHQQRTLRPHRECHAGAVGGEGVRAVLRRLLAGQAAGLVQVAEQQVDRGRRSVPESPP